MKHVNWPEPCYYFAETSVAAVDIMSWPGHDDSTHFELGWLFDSPRLRTALARIGGVEMAVRLAQAFIVMLVLALLVSLVIFRSDVKASLSKSLERMGRSAEAQGKCVPDTVHLIATKISDTAGKLGR